MEKSKVELDKVYRDIVNGGYVIPYSWKDHKNLMVYEYEPETKRTFCYYDYVHYSDLEEV